jgi:hypothetical protein
VFSTESIQPIRIVFTGGGVIRFPFHDHGWRSVSNPNRHIFNRPDDQVFANVLFASLTHLPNGDFNAYLAKRSKRAIRRNGSRQESMSEQINDFIFPSVPRTAF